MSPTAIIMSRSHHHWCTLIPVVAVVILLCDTVPLVCGQIPTSTPSSTPPPPSQTMSATSPITSPSPSPITSPSPSPTTSPSPSPSTPPPKPPGSPIVDYSRTLCTCDVSGNACDVECCCDPDCSAPAVSMFSHCSGDYVPPWDDDYCYTDLPVVFHNHEYYNITRTSAGLFCIVVDNYKDRKYYKDISAVETEQDFDMYASEQVGDPEDVKWSSEVEQFMSIYEDTGDEGSKHHYKSGDPLLVRYAGSGVCDVMRLPAEISGACIGWSRGARVLADDRWDCFTAFTQSRPLSRACKANSDLAAHTYFEDIQVLRSPAFISLSPDAENRTSTNENMTETQRPVVDYGACAAPEVSFVDVKGTVSCDGDETSLGVDSDDGKPCASAWQPSVVGEVCEHVVGSVQYVITVNSSGVVQNVTAEVSVRNVPTAASHVRQTFSYRFVWLENAAGGDGGEGQWARSGNVGYDFGKPVITGVWDDSDPELGELQLSPGTERWMSILVSGGGGSRCGDHGREAVGFGVDTFSGCMLEVDARSFPSSCDSIQRDVLGYLLGNGSVDALYVAQYGDWNASEPSQWVAVLVENMPEVSAEDAPSLALAPAHTAPRCSELTLALHVHILYANTHSLELPQAKIVGVRYVFDEAGRGVQLRCVGVQCQQGSYTQLLEVRSAVTFTDVSQPPATQEARMPRLETKLPYDFFYPFFLNSGAKLTYTSNVVSLLMCGLSVVVSASSSLYLL